MTWLVAVELLILTACGGAAWGVYRAVAKRLGGAAPDSPMTVAGAIRRLVVSAIFPLVWAGLVTGVSFLLPLVIRPSGVIGAAVPVLWFFMIYPLASILIVRLMPRRSAMRLMTHLAVAVGLVVVAVHVVDHDKELQAVANFPLVSVGPAVISIAVVLKSLFLFWVLFIIASRVTAFLQERLASTTDIDPSLSFALTRFLKFFLFTLGVLITLDTAGVKLSTLTIFGGALGLGLGFGLQNIANNLVSGIMLLLDRSIKQGDVITVGDSYGWVVKLHARYIVVRTRDGVEKLIPNANLIASEITNWTHSDRAVRLHVKVGVSYNADPFKVRELLLHVADTHERVLKYPQPNVLFVNFGDSSLDFELRLWINDPQEGVENVRSAMRFEIWKVFKEHGIEIPYPQRDLHIKGGAIVMTPSLPQPEFQESFPPAGKSDR
ncbi:MAG TPA: mechanosensitive ion channel domain-containing protein [Nitrospiria bacterium]|nr:mechanosensitive ion channel domain-containing protein [Nitrospiria bacterium]